MKKKYELTDETSDSSWGVLHRIRALVNIPKCRVKAGELGGWIESEKNLSQDGQCWVADDAMIFGDARVTEDACVLGNARLIGRAKAMGSALVMGRSLVDDEATVCGNSIVSGLARAVGRSTVCGKAYVGGYAKISGYAVISSDAHIEGVANITDGTITSTHDFVTFGPLGSRNDFVTFNFVTRTAATGCFSGDINVFRYRVMTKHASGSLYRAQYLAAIRWFKELESIRQKTKS